MWPPSLPPFRFMTVEGTSKNRIISPGKVLHFYNSPPDGSAESLKEIFAKVSVMGPMGIKFFSQGHGNAWVHTHICLVVISSSCFINLYIHLVCFIVGIV